MKIVAFSKKFGMTVEKNGILCYNNPCRSGTPANSAANLCRNKGINACGAEELSSLAKELRLFRDKEIAVKIRSNSHYRNSRFVESSRNAYRQVRVRRSWANEELAVSVGGRQEVRRRFSHSFGRVVLLLSFCYGACQTTASKKERRKK